MITLKRVWYGLIRPFRRFYWFLIRPNVIGVKCIVEYQGKLLLIRNSYGRKHWTFPGGGVNKNELVEQAAIRETYEEVGIRVDNLVAVGTYQRLYEWRHVTVHCFLARVDSDLFVRDPGEIEEAAWFPINNLPTLPHAQAEMIVNNCRKQLKIR